MPGRTARHHALNDIISQSLDSAGISAIKQQSGLSKCNGKKPDELPLIPWYSGKTLVWDATVVCTLADSYVGMAARKSDLAAECTDKMKWANTVNFSQLHLLYLLEISNGDIFGTGRPSNFVFDSRCPLLAGGR